MALVISRSLKLAIAGTIAGLALAIAGTRLIESMLFQVSGRDPITLGGYPVLGALVIVGCLGPGTPGSARRSDDDAARGVTTSLPRGTLDS